MLNADVRPIQFVKIAPPYSQVPEDRRAYLDDLARNGHLVGFNIQFLDGFPYRRDVLFGIKNNECIVVLDDRDFAAGESSAAIEVFISSAGTFLSLITSLLRGPKACSCCSVVAFDNCSF